MPATFADEIARVAELRDRVMRGDIGQRSIAEGWASALWQFVEEERRSPMLIECAKLRNIRGDRNKEAWLARKYGRTA